MKLKINRLRRRGRYTDRILGPKVHNSLEILTAEINDEIHNKHDPLSHLQARDHREILEIEHSQTIYYQELSEECKYIQFHYQFHFDIIKYC